MSLGIMGLVTCGSRAEARRLAGALLDARAAACVNIVDGIESHYCWRGKRERSREWLLLIKTTSARRARVVQTVKASHSYEVPEIIFVPITSGEQRYMQWLKNAVRLVIVALLWGATAGRASAASFDELSKQLGDEDPEIRAEAADGLAQMGGPQVEKLFREMLKSTNPERRQTAVVGLLQVSDTEPDLQSVRERLQDENAVVRWSAALALGQSGRPEALPWLQEAAAKDSADSVREAATEGVTKLRSSIPWQRSLADGLKQAKRLNKPVLVYFTLRGSEYCQSFEAGVLADRAVVDAAQEFVPVWIDAARQTEVVHAHDVRGTPTVLVLDGQGNEMLRFAGLVEKQEFLTRLAEARRSKLTFREARRLALQDPADVAANWKVAETYLADGREDLAEPHLRNVITHDEANEHGYTNKAMFALGFLLGKRGDYAQGAFCLTKLLERWPEYKDRDKALYCLGLCQLASGHKAEGQAALEKLIAEFPTSALATHARDAIGRLQGNDTK